MEQFEVSCKVREQTGKGPAGRARREGWIPAVIYSHGGPAQSLSCFRRELGRFLQTGHHVVALKLDDGSSRRAMIKDIQVRGVTSEVLHVDFQEIAEHERIEIVVPINFRGDPAGVKDGGVFEIIMHDLEVSCPADIAMDEIRVDVSGVGLNQALHVADIKLPEGVTAVREADQVVAVVRLPRGETAEAEVAEAGEGVQPEVITERKQEEE